MILSCPENASRSSSTRSKPSSMVRWSGGSKVGEGLADDTAQPRPIEGASDLGLEVVHVGDRRDAALDGFERSEQCPDPDHLGSHECPLHRQHIAEEPVVHILAKSAKQGHGQMGVRVHHARHDNVAARIQHLRAWNGGRSVGPERHDPVALDVDPSALDDGHAVVDRQQAGVDDQDRRHRAALSRSRMQHCSGTGTSVTGVPGSRGVPRAPLATTGPAAVSARYW